MDHRIHLLNDHERTKELKRIKSNEAVRRSREKKKKYFIKKLENIERLKYKIQILENKRVKLIKLKTEYIKCFNMLNKLEADNLSAKRNEQINEICLRLKTLLFGNGDCFNYSLIFS